MLEGKKTYIGIALAILGSFGAFNYISESDITTTLNVIVEVTGFALAAYGRFKAKPQ